MKKITYGLFVFCFAFFTWQSNAQEACDIEDLNPEDAAQLLVDIQSMGFGTNGQAITPVGPITVPFQPHIIRNDAGSGGANAATVIANIAAAAGHYAAYGIILDVKPIIYTNSTALQTLGGPGVDGKPEGDANLPGLNVTNHVNAYFIPLIYGSSGGLIGGYARFPWNGPDYFTVANGNLEANGATVAHEMGHYFGLLHTFETALGAELVNGSNCGSAGDLLCDTPADGLSFFGDVNSGSCAYAQGTDSNGDAYVADATQIMSYNQPFSCVSNFSAEADARMRFYMGNDDPNTRSYLFTPTAVCQNITVQLDAGGNVTVTGAAINGGSTDPNGDTLTYTLSTSSFTCADIGANTVTLTATDPNGFFDTCTATITVADTLAPTISCQATISVGNDAGTCGAAVTYTAPVGIDNCSGASTSQTAGLASGSTFPIGTTTNTFVVTDAAGLTATCSFNVVVTDTQGPAISCLSNISVNNDTGLCGAVVNYTAPVGTDNCTGASTSQTAGLASGSTFPIGTTTNTFVVTDAAGLTATCSFNVVVTDTQGPAISCLSNISVNNDTGLCGAVVNYTAPVGTDNCTGASTSQTAGLVSGSTFPVGTTTNTFVVTDGAGLTATCSFDVTVIESEVPTFTCPTVGGTFEAITLTDPSGDGIFNGSDVTTSPLNATPGTNGTLGWFNDGGLNCFGNAVAEYSGAPTVDGLFNMDPAGNFSTPMTFNNGDIIDSTTGTTGWGIVSNLTPGTYNLGLHTLSDNYGYMNISYDGTDITINSMVINSVAGAGINVGAAPSTNLEFTTSADGNLGDCLYTVNGTILDPTNQTDNCGVASVTNDFNSSSTLAGANLPVGTTTIEWTITDTSGNLSTCMYDVVVTDDQAPEALCTPFTTQLDANGTTSITANNVDGGSNDNCGIASLSVTPSSFTCANIGDNTVTLTVTDVNGLVSTCTTLVTVEDNVGPDVLCTSINVVLDTNGMASITAADVDGGTTDACGIDTLSIDIMDFTCSDIGANDVTLTATDVNGNTSTCIAVVTVVDDQTPVITCAADVSVNSDAGLCGAIVTFVEPTVVDNCSVTVAQTAGLASGSEFPVGVSTVEYTVTDAGGNIVVCDFTITVEDNEPAVAVCQDITVELDATGVATIVATDVDGGSADACGVATVSIDVATFDCSNVGTNDVILTVTDVNGNVSTCTAVVTVLDLLAPVITCPADQTVVYDTGSSSYTVPDYFATGEVTVTDNCTDPVTLTSQDPATGMSIAEGVYTVTLTVEDAFENVTECTFELTVEDVLSVGENNANISTVLMYPNPASDFVTISNPQGVQLETVAMYDITGRLVISKNLSDMIGEETINVSKLSSATYMVLISGPEGQIIKQLIKE